MMDQFQGRIRRPEGENDRLNALPAQPNGDALLLDYLKKTLGLGEEMTVRINNDDAGTVVGISEQIALYGYNPRDFISGSYSFWDIVHPDDRDGLRQSIGEKINQNRGCVENFRIQTRAGTAIRVLATLMPVPESGNVTEILAGIRSVPAEKQQFSEQECLQTLGDNFPGGCLFRVRFNRQNREMKIIYLSKKWEELTGIPIENAMSDIGVCLNVVHPDDLPACMAAAEKSAASASRFDVEVRVMDPSGNFKWVNISSQPRPEGGSLVCDGMMLDITGRKQIEREMIGKTERLEALGNNLPNGCLYRFAFDTVTQEMSVAYTGQNWESVTGLSHAETKDISNIFAAVLPEDLPYFQQAIRESARNLSNFSMEIRIRHTGEIHWVQLSSHPHREDRMVVWDGIITDITTRKFIDSELAEHRNELERLVQKRTGELEQSNRELSSTTEEFAAANKELVRKNEQLQNATIARKQVMAQLEDSENKMRNFIQQSFEGIIILDHEGKVIEWNRAQEKISGIPRENAIGRYEWDLQMPFQPKARQTEEIYEQIRTSRQKYLKKGRTQKPVTESLTLYMPDGTCKYMQISMFPIGLNDETCYFGRILHDITEQRLADMELERYQNQLELMVEDKTSELVSSQEQLVLLSNNLPGGVIFQMYDRGGINNMRFTYISAQLADVCHMSVTDVMADSALLFKAIHPDDREMFRQHYRMSVDRGFIDMEIRIQIDTGEIKWIHTRSTSRQLEDGTLVWDGFMVDVTGRKKAEQEVKEAGRRQGILIKVLQIIQSSENLPDAISISLSEIGKYAGVSRVYVFEKSPDGRTVKNTYEWCNEGVRPEIDNLQAVPIEYMQDWFDVFQTGGYVCASDIKSLSKKAFEELSAQGIRSILVLPLVANGVNYGFVGFDECIKYKEWELKETELLISLSQIISTTAVRLRAEKSMKLSQQIIHTVLDNINARIYVSDFNTWEILFANKKIKEELGGHLEGKKCWQVLQQGQTGPCSFCPKPRLLDENGKPTGLYYWQIKNQIVQKWFECTDVAIEWVDGRLAHMEYATDITDRKKAEEDLRQSEEMYRQLTVASPDAIVVCSPDGKVKYISPKAEELFRLKETVEDPSGYHWQKYIHPHDRKKAYQLFQMIIQDQISFLPQLSLVRDDGVEFLGEVSAASVKDKNGDTASAILVIRDVTERKKSEMELIRAKEKAEESDKLKSAFLANMSHEIRTPVNGIIGFVNFLADDNLPSYKRREYINIVNNSNIQLVKLIDDIIDVAKIEARQMSIRSTLLNVNKFMHELNVFFETFLKMNSKRRVALILDDSQFIDACNIYVDPVRLRQILTNLIGNAVKFTEKGFIRFGYRRHSVSMLEFFVEDTGIGLSKDQFELIFERFRQAELTSSRQYGGTGLGLTISRSLSQLMGGDIYVNSEKGTGSTFYFTISYIPIAPKDEPIFDSSNNTGNINNVTNISNANNINNTFKDSVMLLIEPDKMMYQYYKTLLSSTGISIHHAQNIQQWADLASQMQRIDATLVSASVLEHAEREKITNIKSVKEGIPLILAVPENNEYYRSLAHEYPCSQMLQSPVTFADMYDALKTYGRKK